MWSVCKECGIVLYYHLVMTHSSPWKITIFKFGKPSISMGHLYHGYVSHNQRVDRNVFFFYPPEMGAFHWSFWSAVDCPVSSSFIMMVLNVCIKKIWYPRWKGWSWVYYIYIYIVYIIYIYCIYYIYIYIYYVYIYILFIYIYILCI